MASAFTLTSTVPLLTIALAVVVIAFLVNRFAARKKRHVRRTVILGLIYFAGVAASHALAFAHLDTAAHVARQIGELFGALTIVSLSAITLFDLCLPAIGIEAAPILTDVAIGIGYLTATLVTMHQAGIDLSGLVATSALLTTITAFSLQGTLSNVVGGMALQIDDSIRVGDWVQLENGKQGKVREIRWRYTVIETRDWDTLVVPNATLLSGTIIILGKREGQALQHRMWVYFNVDFRYNPSDVIHAVEEALHAAPIEGVAVTPKANCICYDFAKDTRDSFGYYAIRYWLTDLAADDPTSSRVRERLYAALKRANIPLAVPATQVWVETNDQQRRDRKEQHELDRRVAALDGVEFLKALHPEERLAAAKQLRYAPFAPNEIITHQGAVAHWLYIIAAGRAEVRVSRDGAERVVAVIDAPGFVGEMGLMTGEPRTATIVAMTEVECYRLDKEVFRKILAERPEIAENVSTMLAHRKYELQAIVEGLDDETKKRCVEAESSRMLGRIRGFFGLESDERAA